MIKVLLFAIGFSMFFFGGIILIDKNIFDKDDFRF